MKIGIFGFFAIPLFFLLGAFTLSTLNSAENSVRPNLYFIAAMLSLPVVEYAAYSDFYGFFIGTINLLVFLLFYSFFTDEGEVPKKILTPLLSVSMVYLTFHLMAAFNTVTFNPILKSLKPGNVPPEKYGLFIFIFYFKAFFNFIGIALLHILFADKVSDYLMDKRIFDVVKKDNSEIPDAFRSKLIETKIVLSPKEKFFSLFRMPLTGDHLKYYGTILGLLAFTGILNLIIYHFIGNIFSLSSF